MDYDYLKASDGTGDAALMHVEATRSIGSTTIEVDTTAGVPAKFIATSGTLGANNLLTPPFTNFKGHLNDGNLQIDGFENGSSDIGNTEGQVIIIKPNTGWTNRVANFIENLTGFGTPQPLTLAALTATAINAVSLILTNNLTVDGNTQVNGSITIAGTSSVVGVSEGSADGSGNIRPTSQVFSVTALAEGATVQVPSYAPADGMSGILRIRDNGTAQGLTWAAGWSAIGVTLPTATSGSSRNIYVSYIYDSIDSAFCVVGIARQ
jgi:hypothetical protein